MFSIETNAKLANAMVRNFFLLESEQSTIAVTKAYYSEKFLSEIATDGEIDSRTIGGYIVEFESEIKNICWWAVAAEDEARGFCERVVAYRFNPTQENADKVINHTS